MLWMMKRAGKKNNNNKGWQLWLQNNHPLEIANENMFHQKLEYIHQNPVVAGFVDKEEEYLYSSARDFCGSKGLIKLNYIVCVVETQTAILCEIRRRMGGTSYKLAPGWEILLFYNRLAK